MSARPQAAQRRGLRLAAQPGGDPIRALRALLKLALRRFGLRCVSLEEVPHA
jgi:hypothetical protein